MVKLKKIISYIEAVLKLLFLFVVLIIVAFLLLFYNYFEFLLIKLFTESPQ